MIAAVVEISDVDVSKLPVLSLDDADDDSSCGQSEEGGPNCSDSEPKDSGIDCSADVELPDDETAASILKMVEFYLSDTNILKDPFLLKHVRRNKEGYVSVKLLASFRKVRSLCRNWQAVAHSVRRSKELVLNDDSTKVRRVVPLPEHDETVPSRMVIAHGFDTDKPPSVEGISEIFSKFGDIALVRILRPGGTTPTDVKRFLSKNPEIQSKICALVEFEEHASAKRATETEHDGFQVLSLAAAPKQPGSPKHEPSTSESPKKKKKRNKKQSRPSEGELNPLTEAFFKNRRGSSGSISSQSSGYLSSSPNGSFFENRFPRRHSLNPSMSYNDPNSSFASLSNRNHGSRDRLNNNNNNKEKKPEDQTPSDTPSPWRRRREQMMRSDANLTSSGPSVSPSPLSLPVKTVRMPKGPDGTRGFASRARSMLPSTAE